MPSLFVVQFILLYVVFTAHITLSFSQRTGWGAPFRASSASGAPSYGATLDNVMNNLYNINITLGGQSFGVQLDSGSSDLWVYSPGQKLNVLNDSGLTANITYGSGEVSGPIHFAELKFGEYTIPSQAFINANYDSELSAGVVGIMGISFDDILESVVEQTIQTAWGNQTKLGFTSMSNLFAQNGANRTYYDIALGRHGDLEEWSEGSFLVGSHASGYEAVEQAPKLPVLSINEWYVALEGISVNGNNISLKQSATPNLAPDGTLLALLDSGTTDGLMPEYLADAIYSTIPGALKLEGTWLVPCYGGANVSMFMGGQEFPVHPLDLAQVQNVTSNDSTLTICVASYSIDSDIIGKGGPDVILGDAFLRNVYASFNFGQNNTLGIQIGRGRSFVQLLSTTAVEEAWIDFIVSRTTALQQTPYVVDPVIFNATFAKGLEDNSTDDSNATDDVELVGALSADASGPSASPQSDWALLEKYGPVVVGLLAANLLLMVIVCVIAVIVCTRVAIRSGAKSRSVASNYAPVSFRDKFDGDSDLQEPIRTYEDRA